MKTIIIGIAGGTGSGKTTLTEKLRDHFGANEVSVLNHDSYYKRHDELPYEERCKLNYDHPDSFDTPLLYGMTEYVGRSYSERSTNYGYGGRTSTNVVIKPKKSKDSMIVPASGHVLLAEDLGGSYGYTVVIDHGAGLAVAESARQPSAICAKSGIPWVFRLPRLHCGTSALRSPVS